MINKNRFTAKLPATVFFFILIGCVSLFGQQKTLVCFSDLHFDPLSNASLVDTLNKSPFDKWEVIFNNLDSTGLSKYGNDSNYRLFDSFLSGLKSADPDPGFIIYGGDFLAHNFLERFRYITKDTSRNASDEFISKTFGFIAAKISRMFPNTHVYFTLGNNDSFTGDYNAVWNGNFFKDTAPVLFDNFIFDNSQRIKFLSFYSASGSYSVSISTKQKLISLNTNFLSAKCPPDQSVNGEKVLSWLENELESARKNNEKVWLINHIPPGVDVYTTTAHHDPAKPLKTAVLFMTKKYNDKLISIIEKYSDVITACFSGHIHTEDFRVYKSEEDNSPVGFTHIVPSISPIFQNNPAFQIFKYDEQNFSLLDYDTYYLDLSVSIPEWKFEYSFDKTYGYKSLDKNTFNGLADKLQSDEAARNNYISYYYSQSKKASIIKYINAYLCGISSLTDSTYVVNYNKQIESCKTEKKK